MSMRDACSQAIYELGKENPRIIAMSADQDKTFTLFKEKIPERYIDAGIAEANMVGIAAGLAHSGFIPYVTSIAGILTMRACEQIRDDVCYNRLPVRIVGHGAGISYGTLGTTHHAVEDLAMMRSIPNMTVVVPADAIEVKKVIIKSIFFEGPMYIRLGTGDDPVVYEDEGSFPFEIGKTSVLRKGNRVKIFGVGSCLAAACAASDTLRGSGIEVGVFNVHTIKPLDKDFLLKEAQEAEVILTVEEHNHLGGLGSALAELFMGRIHRPMRILGIPDVFSDVADRKDLYVKYGIDSGGILEAIHGLLKDR
jgi:transketolase